MNHLVLVRLYGDGECQPWMFRLDLTTCWSCCCHGKWKLTRVPTWARPAGWDQCDSLRSDHNLSSAAQAAWNSSSPSMSDSLFLNHYFVFFRCECRFIYLTRHINPEHLKMSTVTSVLLYQSHIYCSNCANNVSQPTEALFRIFIGRYIGWN